MNPPFGTRRKGADMDFLAVALKVKIDCSVLSSACEWFYMMLLLHKLVIWQVASQAVYSLHKTSTRDVSPDPLKFKLLTAN